ncbi:flippase [Blautia massiliensis (ex Durand et al. 2017)]|uniref:flippase n=1 Tax=Blautia massiliensis (ex Durand et al. 2017) TaxID=1737424 RepID=UPI00241D536B|nr:flippase [Blautia massiliensis (ex Durand et al. 2017)]MBN2955072.1 flippase [Blautia massiliensis (ex Durand et al. 2017)]
MQKVSSLRKNAFLNIVYKLSSILFPLITYPYVSRILLADNLGRVSFFTSLTNYMLMIGSLGISTYGIRIVAKTRNNKRELSVVVKELLIINLVVTFIASLFLIASIIFVEKFQKNLLLMFISLCQILIAPLGMEWLYGGLEQYEYIAKRSITMKIISLIFIFLFVHEKEDYIIYAAILMLGYIGNYICNFVYSKKFIDYSIKQKWKLKRHLKAVLILFASILAINIYTNVDTLMLGFIKGDRAVGLYDVACKGKLVLLSLINAISTVLFPRLSYYLAEKDIVSYNKVLKKSISVIMGIAIPLSIFFVIEAKDVVIFLGGNAYEDATLCMQILMPILIISGFSNITGNQILLPHGKDISYMRAVMTGAIVDIILNLFFMPRYSLYGAAFATLMAEIVQMLLQLWQARVYLKDNVDFVELLKIIFACIISTIVIYNLKCTTKFSLIIGLGIYFIIYMIIYLFMLIVFKCKCLKTRHSD